MEEKLHWYMFVFHEGNKQQSMYSGLVFKKVSKRIIEQNIEFCNMSEHAMCANICYIGHMTTEEFNG